MSLRHTRHGPVISDIDACLAARAPADAGEIRHVLAMRWSAYDPSNTFRALPDMNRAGDAAAFRAALWLFDNPHQNVVFADTAGTIGYQMAGHVPVRGDRLRPPSLPVPGWTGEHDWVGRLPFEEHPAVREGEADFIVTANNRQVAGPAGDLISSAWEAPYRAQRITQMIEMAGTDIDVPTVHRMQIDVLDLHAQRYRGHAIDAARSAGMEDVAAAFGEWDLLADSASHGAALFYAWYYAMQRELAEDLYDDDAGYMPNRTVDRVLDVRAIAWREDGDVRYEAAARAAAEDAFDSARGQAWGELHGVAIRHAMGDIALLDRLLDLDVGPHPLGGSQHTVNVSQFVVDSFPVTAQYGPSQRHVVDMADVNGSGGFILPAGQSGLPFSEHYRDQHETWVDGGLWLIPLDTALARARSAHVTRLRPPVAE